MARADRLTIRQKKRKVYSDFFTNFNKNEFTGYLGTVENEEAVKQAFRNLMLTNHGERFFDSNKGSNITDYLFENVTPDMFELMKMDIQSAVQSYDPRITINDIVVPNYNATDKQAFDTGGVTQLDNNTVSVRIIFSVVNIPDPLSVDIDVRRIR